MRGIWYALKTEKNLKIDLVITVAVIIAAYLLSVSKVELLLLVIAICLVLSAEMMNTAIEKVVDLICIDILKEHLQLKEFNTLAKLAKDIAAGSVLVTAVMAAIIGLVIFIPKVYALY